MRAATDNKLIELQKKFSSLKETNERGEKSREKLSGELKDMKKKVIVNRIVGYWMLCPSMLQCLVTMIYTRREVLKMTCPLRIRRQPSITLHLAMFTARFFINFEYNLILINSIKPVPLNLPNLIQVMPIVKPPKTTEVKGTETLPQVLSGQSIPCLKLKLWKSPWNFSLLTLWWLAYIFQVNGVNKGVEDEEMEPSATEDATK